MFQWNTRIAAFLIVSAAMATSAAAQPHKGGGAPAARPAPAAPAPHAAPAPCGARSTRRRTGPTRFRTTGCAADRGTASRATRRCTPCRCSARRAAYCCAPRYTTYCCAPRYTAYRCASRCAAAACASLRSACVGHGPACATLTNFCGSCGATAAGQRRPAWRESCPTEPAAGWAGRRFRHSTARWPQCRSTTKRGSATGCDSAESGEPHRSAGTTKHCSATRCDSAESGEPRRSTICCAGTCCDQPTRFLRRCAAQTKPLPTWPAPAIRARARSPARPSKAGSLTRNGGATRPTRS
jgi:hypothetical protein